MQNKALLWARRCAGLALIGVMGVAQAADWVVGQVAPLSGPAAKQGRAYAQGMLLYFDQVNLDGGVQGRNIELVTMDDAGQATETVEKTRALLRDKKPLLLAGYMGNRNVQALLDSKLLDNTALPVVGYQSTDTRVQSASALFSTRAGLREQVSKIAAHMNVVSEKRVALVHDERPDAKDLADLVSVSLASAGVQLVSVQPLGTGRKRDVEAAVAELRKPNPDVQSVLVVASSSATAAFVEAYRMDGGRSQLYALAEADAEQLATRLPTQYMSGLSIAQVVPNPFKVSIRLNKEFQDTMSRIGKPADVGVSFTMMEGFVTAKVIVEAMRRTKPLTPERLAQTMRGLDGFDAGGYWVGYAGGSQIGSKYVDLSMINNVGRITQ